MKSYEGANMTYTERDARDWDRALKEKDAEIARLKEELERRERHHAQARRSERDIGLEIALEEVSRSWGEAPTTDEANRLNELGDRIRAHIGTDRTSELMAEIARLRAALKPFAETAQEFPEKSDTGGVILAMAHCRAAFKALEEP